jgi:predicted DNA-binding transcriptional regulator AlpA
MAISAANRRPAGVVQRTGPPISRDKLTVSEVCTELQIAASTFYEWRTKRCGPRCIKLPNGQFRVRRIDLDAWLEARGMWPDGQHHL